MLRTVLTPREVAFGPDERFDTVLLLGNNLGLLAGERPGRHLLRKLGRLVMDNGRILAGSYDPSDDAGEPALSYQARNRARGRMGGVERVHASGGGRMRTP